MAYLLRVGQLITDIGKVKGTKDSTSSENGEGLQDFYQVENRVMIHIHGKLVQPKISNDFRRLKIQCFSCFYMNVAKNG